MLFDAAGSWSLGNEFARNDVIFVVDNNWSGLFENRKINFLILDEWPVDDNIYQSIDET